MTDEPLATGELISAEDSAREQKRQALFAKIQDTALEAIERLTREKKDVPHSAELLEEIYRSVGGPQGFAALLVAQYFAIEEGKPGRNRILEAVMRMTMQNTQVGGANKPTHLMDTDELERELQGRMKRIVDASGLKIAETDAA